jgi:AcrR family transcriptional regulator
MGKEATRERIVRAVRSLHEEVGPAATTVTAIAERAGVQRLTVYRHFPDEAALIGACAADWRADHPLPDPRVWSGLADPRLRLRTALERLYRYFRSGAPMLGRVLRDEAVVPPLAEVLGPWWGYMREVASGLAAGWGVEPGAQRRVRAAVGHALRFGTWRSLSGEGLSVDEAADLMARWVEAVAGPGSEPGAGAGAGVGA